MQSLTLPRRIGANGFGPSKLFRAVNFAIPVALAALAASAAYAAPGEVKLMSFASDKANTGGLKATRPEAPPVVVEDSPDYLPPNSYASARVIVGVDASAGVASQTDPLPVVLRITGPARSVLQNGKVLTTRIQGCVVNRIATDKAAQIEAALVDVTIDAELGKYVNGLADRGHFDAVQVAPASSAEVPDEASGVRAVVLGVAHPHHGRDGSEALVEAKDILTQRGSTPRVYRNMLVFIAADSRQLDNLKDAVRSALAWSEIVRDIERLNLTQSDSALAKAKLTEANETVKTRLKEAWCYLHYPAQESTQADVEWVSGKIPAQDGLLARASKKLVAEEGLLTELGPTRLDRDLQKYIWNGKPHLSLRDLREYLSR